MIKFLTVKYTVNLLIGLCKHELWRTVALFSTDKKRHQAKGKKASNGIFDTQQSLLLNQMLRDTFKLRKSFNNTYTYIQKTFKQDSIKF